MRLPVDFAPAPDERSDDACTLIAFLEAINDPVISDAELVIAGPLPC